MFGVKEMFRRIYSGENVLQKHIIIFAITGIVAMVSNALNDMSKNLDLIVPTCVLSFLCLILSFFMVGYMCNFIHNTFDKENENIVPEFCFGQFKIAFKALPIILAWLGYGILVSVFIGFVAVFSKLDAIIIGGITFIGLILFLVMQPMLYVNFSKNYDSKGLKSFVKPFTYIPETFGQVLVLLIKVLPFAILAHVIALFGVFDNVFSYILAMIGGYMLFIVGMVANYGYAQIFDDKYER